MRRADYPKVAISELSLAEYHSPYGTLTHESNEPYLKSADDRDSAMGRNARIGDDFYRNLGSLQEASDVLSCGWQEGASKLTGCADEIAPPMAKSRRRKPEWCDVGDELDADRAIRGDWDTAWRSSKRVWSSGPSHVTVYAPFGGGCHESADRMFWSGAAALIVVDKLEQAGYSVRLVGTHVVTSTHSNKACRNDVILKESTDPLQIDALASVLCHAGIVRTFGFSALCSVPTAIGEGLGYANSLHQSRDLFADVGELPEGAIILDSSRTREACLAEIQRVIATLTTDA